MADESNGKTDKQAEKKKLAWKSLPDAWALLKPRKGILALGLLLICISRVAGFAIPAASKFLFDNVIAKRQIELLIPIILGVITATIVQGATSFTLTQLFSNRCRPISAGCRLVFTIPTKPVCLFRESCQTWKASVIWSVQGWSSSREDYSPP